MKNVMGEPEEVQLAGAGLAAVGLLPYSLASPRTHAKHDPDGGVRWMRPDSGR